MDGLSLMSVYFPKVVLVHDEEIEGLCQLPVLWEIEEDSEMDLAERNAVLDRLAEIAKRLAGGDCFRLLASEDLYPVKRLGLSSSASYMGWFFERVLVEVILFLRTLRFNGYGVEVRFFDYGADDPRDLDPEEIESVDAGVMLFDASSCYLSRDLGARLRSAEVSPGVVAF